MDAKTKTASIQRIHEIKKNVAGDVVRTVYI